jgi:hypothetical protein
MQPPTDIVHCSLGEPAKSILNGVESWEEKIAPASSTFRPLSVCWAEHGINGRLLSRSRFGSVNVQVHVVFVQLSLVCGKPLDPDGGCLKLRSTGLGIGGVDS